MAYRDDIAALNPDHHWIFEDDYNDDIGSANGTSSGAVLTGSAICEDANNSMELDGRSDRVTLANQTDMNNAAIDRRAMGGWFQIDSPQTPPCLVYVEGNDTAYFQMVFGFGNYVMYEIRDGSGIANALQIITERFLADDRAYHLFMKYEGSSYGNFFKAYLDGVLIDTITLGTADLDTHAGGVPTWGDPTGTVGVGGDTVLLVAPNTANYNHWASWSGADAASLSDTEIREELFEKGALPGTTISAGTEAAMQTSLDALADTVRPDEPLNIRVETVTGDGDLTLDADNITHNALASIHVQYMGTGTLTWRNTNGSDASIGSTPNGGTIEFLEPVDLTVTVRDAVTLSPVEDARVLIEADSGGPLTAGTTILSGLASSGAGSNQLTGTLDFSSNQPYVGKVRRGSTSPLYKTGDVSGTITSAGLDITVLLVPDE